MPNEIMIGQINTILPALSAQLQGSYVPQVVSTSAQVIFREIKFGTRLFRLNEPLAASVSCENGYYYLESKQLSILAFGRSRDEATKSFCEDFAMRWDVIAQAPDDALTSDARVTKREFQLLVSSASVE